jgi:glycogen synthase kinase 3 beta
MLEYSPKKRITPLKGLLHPFFDDLRAKNCKINGRQIPDLFDFTKEELSEDPSLFSQLVPEWYVKKKKRQQQKTATEDA